MYSMHVYWRDSIIGLFQPVGEILTLIKSLNHRTTKCHVQFTCSFHQNVNCESNHCLILFDRNNIDNKSWHL